MAMKSDIQFSLVPFYPFEVRVRVVMRLEFLLGKMSRAIKGSDLASSEWTRLHCGMGGFSPSGLKK
jgi:hypothetical protein